jgi:hypothetical protein
MIFKKHIEAYFINFKRLITSLNIFFKYRSKITFAQTLCYTRWLSITQLYENAISKNKCKHTTYNSLKKYVSSDTLFILGSGPSVNLLNDENWQLIKDSDSIGINKFLAHSFVPTFFHYEVEKDYLWQMKNGLQLRKVDYLNTPIIINAWHWDIIDNGINDLDFLNHENLFFSIPSRFSGLSIDSIGNLLFNIYNGSLPKKNNFLFHHSSSLILMVSFAVMMKYKNIVLVGFDLYDNDYFYHSNNKYINECKHIYMNNTIKNFENKEFAKHSTTLNHEMGKVFENGTLETMFSFKKNVLNPLNINIYSTSKKSLLNEFIDPYENFFV